MSDIRLVTSADPKIDLVFFMDASGGGEATLLLPSRTVRVNVDPAPDGWRIVVTRERGYTEIVYRKIDG